MAWTIEFGGTQLGTELLADLPGTDRQRPPIVHAGIGHERAVLEEEQAAILKTIVCRIWHEADDVHAFTDWLNGLDELFLLGRQDLVVRDDGVVKRTYPQCALLSVPRPMYSDQTDGRFSDALEFVFQTDQAAT